MISKDQIDDVLHAIDQFDDEEATYFFAHLEDHINMREFCEAWNKREAEKATARRCAATMKSIVNIENLVATGDWKPPTTAIPDNCIIGMAESKGQEIDRRAELLNTFDRLQEKNREGFEVRNG